MHCLIYNTQTEDNCRYCSEQCLADAVNWGIWHPIIRCEVQEVGYATKQDALKHNMADDAAQRKDVWRQLRKGKYFGCIG